jgi:hypothetical protein
LLARWSALEDQKLAASRETESALRAASDASKQKAERDRLDKDRQETATELANLRRKAGVVSMVTASCLGVTFNDGIEVIAKPTDRQPITAAA